MKMFKKILLILIFVSFLMGGFCFAQRELEIEYPTVPGVETPTVVKTALPEYLRYIFTFAITIAGLLAFGAMIYGGIRYLTSAGDPTKMKDAMEQVTAGVLGLIILLASYLILNTINPQLVLPQKPPLQLATAGIKIYANSIDCGETSTTGEPGDIKSKMISDSYPELKIEKDSEVFLDWGAEGKNKISSIKFLSEPENLTIEFYSQNYYGEPLIEEYSEDGESYEKKECKIFTVAQPKSIKLKYHPPGVYLYASDDCTGKKYGEDYIIYQVGSATLPEFDNKTKSIKIVYGKDPKTGEYKTRYATILHEKENNMGEATLFDFDPAGNDCRKLSEGEIGVDLTNKVSSITVYLKPPLKNGQPQIIGPGVKFFEDKNHGGGVIPSSEATYYGDGDYDKNLDDTTGGEPIDVDDFNDRATSMEIDGHYIALLFRHPNYQGDCEIFWDNCLDFRNYRIGQCSFLPGLPARRDCLSSFIIKARK